MLIFSDTRYHENVPNSALKGIVAAMATPFREDERIDFTAWQTLVDALIGAGVNGVMVGGSTGEVHALTLEERRVCIRFARQATNRRVPVYANVGCITTRDSVDLALTAQDEGIDVLAVVTPYYVRPSPRELADHYIEICRAVHLPVLAYNFPQHGGAELSPQTVAEIAARCDNFAGVKDSSGDLEKTLAFRNAFRERDLAVFIGPEKILLSALQAGCAGTVSGCANIAPRLFVDLYAAFRRGDTAEAERLQALATEIGGAVGLHTFPAAIKEAMAMAGLPAGPCRKPVGPMPPEAREALAGIVGHLRERGYARIPAVV